MTLVILLIGLLGLAGLQAQAQRSEMESYQRAQALILLQDMAGRINANRKVASCYAYTTDTANGTPYLGTLATASAACSAGTLTQQARAVADMQDWNLSLQGAAEVSGGSNVGAMIGARGCITTIAADTYRITVTWQGLGNTAAPPASQACANTLYGNEAQRRAVSLTVQIADLD